jgi:uncharacterized membrane protein YkvI
MRDIWKSYLLAPFTFMSVVIGGGYATGRELVEFFMRAGPVGGLLAMLVATLVWSVVIAITLELARVARTYDYRSFFRELVGRGWLLFELAFVALLLLTLAVLGAAAGEIARGLVPMPVWVGTLLFLAAVVLIVWRGRGAIEKFLSLWGLTLYVGYFAVLIACLTGLSDRISQALALQDAVQPGWFTSGLTYAGYNVVVVPALLFCARELTSRRHALVSGLLCGPIAMIPGLTFYVAMLGRYPEIMQQPVPLQMLLDSINAPIVAIVIQIAVFGTLVQTGIGVLHGFNERLMQQRLERGAKDSQGLRIAVSVAFAVIAVVLATKIGLIGLIANGYGQMAWVMIAIYVVPLLTLGVWKVFRNGTQSAAAAVDKT